jgi:hypothetical protein
LQLGSGAQWNMKPGRTCPYSAAKAGIIARLMNLQLDVRKHAR